MDKNIGRKLDGRYEITELIGVGGMADVYKAIDILEDRTVAVKILKNEFADNEDFEDLNEIIKNTAKVLGLSDKIHEGMLTTMDVFGPYIDYDRVLNRIPKEYEILGEEMEAFALIHVANSMGVWATAMATVADSKFSNTVMSIEDRQNRLNDMIKLALIAIIK